MFIRSKIPVFRSFQKLCRQRDLHVAIVGSGPAACYSAKYLLDKDKSLKVDIIEKLPIPFGLVRYGVAPDHPEVKSVTTQFEELFAQHSRLRYFGNVEVGDKGKVTLQELQNTYSAVLLAYGSSSDLVLSIPGSDLKGVFSAREFVNWYNGHPEYSGLSKDGRLDLSSVKNVVIIGQGNVAIDCARIMAMRQADLQTTDIAEHSLDELARSTVQSVNVVGRRGHVQAAFTIKELRELTKLDGVTVGIKKAELKSGMTAASQQEVTDNRPKKRIVELIETIATNAEESSTSVSNNGLRELNIRFLLSPKRYIGDEKGHVRAVEFERTQLVGEANSQSVVGTGELEQINCQLVLESIGYRALPISAQLPFCNRTHTVPHLKGRVCAATSTTDGTQPSLVPGLYVSGWLKRGPTGIIGTNITDAKETVASILEDIACGKLADRAECDDPVKELRRLNEDDVVTWNDYLSITAEEQRLGAASSPPRPRVKVVSSNEVMRIVTANRFNKPTSE